MSFENASEDASSSTRVMRARHLGQGLLASSKYLTVSASFMRFCSLECVRDLCHVYGTVGGHIAFPGQPFHEHRPPNTLGAPSQVNYEKLNIANSSNV